MSRLDVPRVDYDPIVNEVCLEFQLGRGHFEGETRNRRVTARVCIGKQNNVFFTASCDVWNYSLTDIDMGGQCFDELEYMFKEGRLKLDIPEQVFKDLVSAWKQHHLSSVDDRFIKWLLSEVYTISKGLTGTTDLYDRFVELLREKLGIGENTLRWW